MTPLTVAIAALVVAAAADVLTTRAGLRSGLVSEANPLMRWWTRTLLRAVVAKLLGLGVVVLALSHLPSDRATALAWLGAGWWFHMAWGNYRLLRAVALDFSVSKSLQSRASNDLS